MEKNTLKNLKKEKILHKVLSNCLKELETNGLICKERISVSPNITEYSLTERGLALNKVIYELAVFTLEDENNNYTSETTKYLKDTFKETLDINN